MLKIPNDVSNTSVNMLNKVCIMSGARENSSLDSDLTYQNL